MELIFGLTYADISILKFRMLNVNNQETKIQKLESLAVLLRCRINV